MSPTFNSLADGCIYFSLDDLAKWDEALQNEKLLDKQTQALMYTPVRLNNGETYPYGFGWMLDDKLSHKDIHHTGSWLGFSGAIDRFVDDEITIILFTNIDHGGSKLTEGIAQIMFQ